MKQYIKTPLNRHTQKGLSLVEMLISMTLGLIVLLVVVNIFVMSKASASLTEGMGRVHENSILGLDYLKDDLKMVGHFGCVGDQALDSGNISYLKTTLNTARSALDFHTSVKGYEAKGTEPGTSFNSGSLSTGGGTFDPALPSDLESILNDRVDNSDIITLRYLNPRSTNIVTSTNTEYPTITYKAADWNLLADFDDLAGLLAISDCSSTTVFQVSNANPASGTITVSKSGLNTTGFTQVYEPLKARLYGITSLIYYVGKSNDAEYPSLFRIRFLAAPSGELKYEKDEIVYGVETMQLLYGQDRSTANRLTGFMDRQQTADQTNKMMATPAQSWRRVGSVKVGLLLVDPTSTSALQKGTASTGEEGTENVLGVTITTPADGRYRSPREATIAIRNRLYGN